MKKFLVLIGLVALVIALVCSCSKSPSTQKRTEGFKKNEYPESKYQDGDIVFQTSKSNQSKAIQLATKSKYSHMGILFWEGEKLYVFEAVQPVKLTPWQEWVKRGENSNFVVKRLKESKMILSAQGVKKLREFGLKFKGRSYDIYFDWSDDKIYCSELVWKMYKSAFDIELGELQELREFDLSNEVVRAKMKERYGDKIPMKERVISPVRIFDSDKLETVY